MDGDSTNRESEMQPALEPEDYYFDGPYMVFTAAYHLKRGHCCESGCRHCPYREGHGEGTGTQSDPPEG